MVLIRKVFVNLFWITVKNIILRIFHFPSSRFAKTHKYSELHLSFITAQVQYGIGHRVVY